MSISWLGHKGVKIVLIIILTLIALRIVRIIIRKATPALSKFKDEPEIHKRVVTLQNVLQHSINMVILTVAALMILITLEINIGPILAAAGVLGLAVGFGAQSLVKDVISGFFILLEDQLRVGDAVTISGKSGAVEKISLRTTVLRDASGNVHFIPNGYIDVVTNMTKDFSRYMFEIGVAYRENIDEVIELMKKADEELRSNPDFSSDIINPLEIFGLDRFDDSAVIIKARTTTKSGQQWRVAREYNRLLKKTFDKNGIEIPYPHVTVYMGEDKTNQAPPLRVEVKNRNSQ